MASEARSEAGSAASAVAVASSDNEASSPAIEALHEHLLDAEGPPLIQPSQGNNLGAVAAELSRESRQYPPESDTDGHDELTASKANVLCKKWYQN